MISKDNLTPIKTISPDCEDPLGLSVLAMRAREFLLSHKWCTQVCDGYMGLGFPGILGVFLFEIVPVRSELDTELWVVTGDIPPAYIVTENAPGPVEALSAYVSEMRRWVAAVRSRGSLEDIIPVNGAPTLENADQLEGRLDFIQSEILDKD